MQAYLKQLLADINEAAANASFPFQEEMHSVHDWRSPEEEDATAPVRNLSEWCGIAPEQLPPATMLQDGEVTVLLQALKKMLDAYNCSFVLQTQVPERIQYETIRIHFSQNVKVRQWHLGFFEMCQPGTPRGTCTLGQHCQCAFYEEFFGGFVDEQLTPEEQRARELEIEIKYLKNKYGLDWMKYYPYHLDKDYDDENGNPHNYGLEDDSEDEGDDWWRK